MQRDARFAASPMVTGTPGFRFYTGMPLAGHSGQRLGTLCVIDTQPRVLDDMQREGLVRLARRAAETLETRRQQIQAEPRERTLAQLLEAMPDAVVTCDASGLLGEFNKVARQWHGVDPRALLSHEWARHFDLYESDAQQLLATERVRDAAIVIRAGGQPPRTVLCNAEPLFTANARLLGVVCVMRDITQRLVAEERVRQSEQRLRTVADNVPTLVAQVGADLRYRFVNRACAGFFDLERENIVSRHMSEILRPEHYAGILPRLQQVTVGARTAAARLPAQVLESTNSNSQVQ